MRRQKVNDYPFSMAFHRSQRSDHRHGCTRWTAQFSRVLPLPQSQYPASPRSLTAKKQRKQKEALPRIRGSLLRFYSAVASTSSAPVPTGRFFSSFSIPAAQKSRFLRSIMRFLLLFLFVAFALRVQLLGLACYRRGSRWIRETASVEILWQRRGLVELRGGDRRVSPGSIGGDF